MALVSKAGKPSLSTRTPGPEHSFAGRAGEDIDAGDACYINADGTIRKSNGTAANPAAVFRGMAGGGAQAGEALTIYRGVNFHYGAGLTPGADLYVATTAGRLDTAATAGGTVPVAYAVDATRIFVRG